MGKYIDAYLLFFVRGGRIDPSNQQLNLAGLYGYYWASRAHSNINSTYILNFNTGVNPSLYGGRFSGFSLRCLIPTS